MAEPIECGSGCPARLIKWTSLSVRSLLAVVAALPVLVGCGGETVPPTPVPTAVPTSTVTVSDGSEIRTLSGHTDSLESVAFSPDGQTLASASDDNTVILWRVSEGSEIRTLMGHTNRVFSVAFSPDGQILASASEDNTVKLWRVK